MKVLRHLAVIAAIAVTAIAQTPAQAQQKQPNIVVIWGDDIGFWNISAYGRVISARQSSQPLISRSISDSVATGGMSIILWKGVISRPRLVKNRWV